MVDSCGCANLGVEAETSIWVAKDELLKEDWREKPRVKEKIKGLIDDAWRKMGEVQDKCVKIEEGFDELAWAKRSLDDGNFDKALSDLMSARYKFLLNIFTFHLPLSSDV